MTIGWAERRAQELLAGLPRRLTHVEAVARRAASAATIADDAELLVCAAWLHDIGYSEAIGKSGFHPVDGASYLRDVGASERLCGLVAHHSAARIEARRRGIEIDWPDEQSALRDALWWADMTTTPDGGVTPVQQRIEEVQQRYGSAHVVANSVAEASPELLAAAARTEQRIADAAAQLK
jgi:hypothetical protein